LFAARPTTSPPDISGYAGAGELQTARPAANCRTGLQALHVSRQLGDTGRLDIVDIQRPMLDHVMRRDTSGRIVATQADARELPFDEGVFDAALEGRTDAVTRRA
jgi:Methyltransferase domain